MRDSAHLRTLIRTYQISQQFITHYAAFSLHVTHAEVENDPIFTEVCDLLGKIKKYVDNGKTSDAKCRHLEEELLESLHQAAMQYALLVQYITPIEAASDILVKNTMLYVQLARERMQSTIQ